MLSALVLCHGEDVTLGVKNITYMTKVSFRKLFERKKLAVFWWALLYQSKSQSGRERQTTSLLGSDHCHLLTLRAGLCGGLLRTVH